MAAARRPICAICPWGRKTGSRCVSHHPKDYRNTGTSRPPRSSKSEEIACNVGWRRVRRKMHMLRKTTLMYAALAAFASGSALADDGHGQLNVAPSLAAHAVKMIAEGQHTFRFDTFGDEDFWTGTL